MNNKLKFLLPIIIAVVILTGFAIAFLLPESNKCTLMGCSCEGLNSERPCNSCVSSKPVFSLGIIHISKSCPAREILLCENNIQVGKRIDIEKERCQYKLSFIVY